MLKTLVPFDGPNCATLILHQLITLAQASREAEVSPDPYATTHRRDTSTQLLTGRSDRGVSIRGKVAAAVACGQTTGASGHKARYTRIVGDIALSTPTQAFAKGCALIMMGNRGMRSIGNPLIGPGPPGSRIWPTCRQRASNRATTQNNTPLS